MSWTTIIVCLCAATAYGMYAAIHSLLRRLVEETAAVRREMEAIRINTGNAAYFLGGGEQKKRIVG